MDTDQSRWLFVFNSSVVHANQDPRSGAHRRQRYDHPTSSRTRLAHNHVDSDDVHTLRFEAPKNVCSIPLLDTTFYLLVVCRENNYAIGYSNEVHIAKPGVMYFLAKPLFYTGVEGPKSPRSSLSI